MYRLTIEVLDSMDNAGPITQQHTIVESSLVDTLARLLELERIAFIESASITDDRTSVTLTTSAPYYSYATALLVAWHNVKG